jgi:hypothetical protein
MTHLTPDELIDALEGVGASTHRSLGEGGHLADCDECRRLLADLQGVLSEAERVSVPEPSPVFWPHFSQRVSAAIENEATPANAWPAWLRWQVLLPLGAVATIVLALLISVPKNTAPGNALVAPAAPIAPVALDGVPSDSWNTVADLVGELDLETASAAGVIEPGLAERAVLELTAAEQQELTRLLKEELTRAKS